MQKREWNAAKRVGRNGVILARIAPTGEAPGPGFIVHGERSAEIALEVLDELEAEVVDLARWKEAIDDAGIVSWTLTDETANNPRKAIAALVQCAVDELADPALSQPAMLKQFAETFLEWAALGAHSSKISGLVARAEAALAPDDAALAEALRDSVVDAEPGVAP